MTSIETKTIAVIARSGFTWKGDSHFRTYRQATITLNRLERAGLIVAEDDGDDRRRWVAAPQA